MRTETVTCCVVGGGPAGMMLGVLLARQGVEVTVLEKHADFLRDFRGDTIHPSTQQIVHELGWSEEFHAIPHSRMDEVRVAIDGTAVTVAEFGRLPVPDPYVAFMPQWDFLDFLAAKAQAFPAFTLRRSTELTDLVEAGGRIAGVRATGPDGQVEIRADLVVACDGRHSRTRAAAGLPSRAAAPPMDVLWFRLPKRAGDRVEFFQGGRHGAMVAVDRTDYWQVAYTIPTGSYDDLRRAGIAELRRRVGRLAPALRDRVRELSGWDDVHQLSVRVDRLRRWHRPGLLCLGDAAHAMSPAGGVGINLAIQDAVAAANRLGPRLRHGTVRGRDLAAVQRRRELPVRLTQAFQVVVLRDLYPKHLGEEAADAPGRPPAFVRAFRRWPVLRRLMGRFIGLGVRREHVRT